MHWGDEYQNYPSASQKQQAALLSELGVDIIIGHHPHVIQPIDIIQSTKGHQTIVFYSLGNFLSDQKGIDRLIGAAGSLTISKVIDKNNQKVSVSMPKVKLLYRYKKDNTFRIKWFENLDESYLLNYKFYFEEKEKLIQTYREITVN